MHRTMPRHRHGHAASTDVADADIPPPTPSLRCHCHRCQQRLCRRRRRWCRRLPQRRRRNVRSRAAGDLWPLSGRSQRWLTLAGGYTPTTHTTQGVNTTHTARHPAALLMRIPSHTTHMLTSHVAGRHRRFCQPVPVHIHPPSQAPPLRFIVAACPYCSRVTSSLCALSKPARGTEVRLHDGVAQRHRGRGRVQVGERDRWRRPSR
eukprot:2400001-Prymnesium_polylepis.1